MVELIKSLLEEIDRLDNLMQSGMVIGLKCDYTRGRRDGYIAVLGELVKIFKSKRGD